MGRSSSFVYSGINLCGSQLCAKVEDLSTTWLSSMSVGAHWMASNAALYIMPDTGSGKYMSIVDMMKSSLGASVAIGVSGGAIADDAAKSQEPSYRVRGILTDGFDSTTKSLHSLFPAARLGNCLRHAITKLPKKLAALASPVRRALRAQFHTLLYRARQRRGLRVFALGQQLRRFADHVATTAGKANGVRVRRWMQEKKAGW
jgi:hypothetical protein